ncbi:hypothetical protein HMPREF9727_01865 [Treponema denticola MYR-T]|uniref:Uncharacterized protein n=1 Tax=Treponema denticola H1-T TaxID=999431 RepID=M2C6S9_TREDN|nr:hypothetical protein HMPREF9727_01865 [Treponema denticola MYR-T]EMB29348.1 hypothetical protein HMPREF9725_02218 [Treponema denticola H1-T]EMB46695.1 hypothetical protein HMPREF9729_01091 [Treponema denticola ASLM]EMD58023.1 hypothetical protein HMPREF9728_00266 [Treponema denticola US-Trep]
MISIKTFLYYCLLGIIGICAGSLAFAIMIYFMRLWDEIEDLLS